ncbi:MAG: DUF2339 domain-containing protein [Paludibacteraceae bacterium]|nr:DUF2339 domain-containing protein [Paludibacteraceae bacterium]
MDIFLIIVTLIIVFILGVKTNEHLKDIRFQLKKNAETLRETKTLAEKLSIQIAQLKGANAPASNQPSTVKEEKKQTAQQDIVVEKTEKVTQKNEGIRPIGEIKQTAPKATAEPSTPQPTPSAPSPAPKPMPQQQPENGTIKTTQTTVPPQSTSKDPASAPIQQPTAQQRTTTTQPNTAKAQPFSLGKNGNTSTKNAKGGKTDYERFIGENLFGKIGILIFILGIGFFVKYAIDKNWISEAMRAVLGFGVGAALIGVGHKLRKGYHTFSSLLVGGGFAVFFITDAIAYHYYGLYNSTFAFFILLVSMLFMVALSIIYDRRELAIIALIGGFTAPFLVGISLGIGILIYMAVLNIGMFAISMVKKWEELPVLSFVATTIIMIIAADSVESAPMARTTFIFATLFYIIFNLPIFYILKFHSSDKMPIALTAALTSNNFSYLAFGLYLIDQMDLSFDANGLFCLFIAAVNTGIFLWMKKTQQEALKSISLAMTLIFAAIFVPMQFKGAILQVAWAAEMVATLWLYIKTKNHRFEYGSFAFFILTGIAIFLFFLGVGEGTSFMNTDPESTEKLFLNKTFISNIFVVGAFLASALLMDKFKPAFEEAKLLQHKHFSPLLYTTSVLTGYVTFIYELMPIENDNVRTAALGLVTAGFALLCCCFLQKRFKHESNITLYTILMSVPVATLIWEMATLETPLNGLSLTLWALTAAATFLSLFIVAKKYYAIKPREKSFTILLNILATTAIIIIAYTIAKQLGFNKFTMTFSILMGIIGFVQMCIGMKIHMKLMRIISLFTFGIVLIKLLAIDLWSMPSLGKILVFVLLGLILLILSFLYSKLKNVIFEDENEAKTEVKEDAQEGVREEAKPEEKPEGENEEKVEAKTEEPADKMEEH